MAEQEKKTKMKNQNDLEGKHWTELHQEYARKRKMERRRQKYREIYPDLDIPFDEFGFGDEYFIFDGVDGRPKYNEANEVWDQFIEWLETVRERLRSSEDFQDNCEYRIGLEIIKHARRRNTHHIYILMKRGWVQFRDTYLLVEDCPEYVLEFVRGIMHEKMTEKQMWGTDEDRLLEGTVIVFEERFMPKEGEDTGKLKFEYRPNYIQEMMENMRKGSFR